MCKKKLLSICYLRPSSLCRCLGLGLLLALSAACGPGPEDELAVEEVVEDQAQADNVASEQRKQAKQAKQVQSGQRSAANYWGHTTWQCGAYGSIGCPVGPRRRNPAAAK